ncbi:MAG: MBL fold metallo-hydrolase [Clostridia bacterium]|jgi:glyoxylase-like metal-dependent hydrolase (beta-lactamase superfamily II)|nr:MBL fold metallo-hydrolase [Clostridia bacterium]MCI2001083.1 MBL fold metallo-hydrolase [Clostridia bacterium]MCI2015791.1 MBL fold metallo-hydrolase [Clostridia bacterium]
MYEKVYNSPDIFKINIPLPKNPLKNLNCYVIKTQKHNLIIDTGFNIPECRQALFAGLKELNLDMSKTDLFLTHLHSDHIGLAGDLFPKISNIYMSRVDYVYYVNYIIKETWDNVDNKFIAGGYPKEEIEKIHNCSDSDEYETDSCFDVHPLDDGDFLNIGDIKLKCILTPGHTPGHMCLYIEDKKIMFSGDHVLFDITPNITFWAHIDDPLGMYIESLKKIRKYDVKTVFTSHRKNEGSFYKRIDELLKHHKDRLDECLKIIKTHKKITAYDVASLMSWSINVKSWEDFPPMQKYFAVGEAIAHIERLGALGKINKKNINSVNFYTAI